MLVVAANAWDPRGPALREAWDGADAVLLTPADLSVAGWDFDPSAPQAGHAVIEGKPAPASEIEGICALLPAVIEADLTHIAAGDRAYAAAEMTAFLLAWLTGLPCPKVNAPSPGCLCGPSWRTEQWVRLAASLGLPHRAATRRADLGDPARRPPDAATTVVVAGDRTFGTDDSAVARWATLLAQAAGTRLLEVHIGDDADGSFVLGADVWADVGRPGVAGALLGQLTGRSP
jgi:hypothetical protein